VELINYGTKGGHKYDLLQSCIFGLGIIAMRSPRGQFAQLAETINILSEGVKTDVEGLDEDEKDSKLNLSDNSKSALAKIVLF
jgi:hypothetical protein